MSQWPAETLKTDQDKVALSSAGQEGAISSIQDEDYAPPLKLEKVPRVDTASRIVVGCTFSSWWQKRGSR